MKQVRIPEGDETIFPIYNSYEPAAPASKGNCQLCGTGISVNVEMVTCLHCRVQLHGSCDEKNALCPGCSLPTVRQFDGVKCCESWPCGVCETDVLVRRGFSFCAACGSNFHIKCRGFRGKCPQCGELAPVISNGEREDELSIWTRFLRGQETREDCFIAWLIQSGIALNFYGLFSYSGSDLGLRILGIWCLGTMWWIYCGFLSQRRAWPEKK